VKKIAMEEGVETQGLQHLLNILPVCPLANGRNSRGRKGLQHIGIKMSDKKA
jgi:hypothetical protein